MASSSKEIKEEKVMVENEDEKVASWKTIVVVVTPVLLAPLIVTVDRVEARCAYVVLLMTIFWITEALPMSVTALIPMPLFPLLNVSSANVTASNYFSETNFLIFGSLLMAVAVEASGLQYRVALRILLLCGVRPQWLILGFMLSCAFLSMWIGNTPSCAMMMPIVVVVLEEILRQKRRLQRAHIKTVDDNAIGDIVDKPIPVWGEPLTAEELGLCRAASIGVAFASSGGGVAALTGAMPNLILVGQMDRFFPDQNVITYANWFAFGLPMQLLFMVIGWAWLLFLFTGWRSLIQCFTRSTENDRAIAKLLKGEYQRLGPIRFNEGAVGVIFLTVVLFWIFREPGSIPGWGELFNPDYVSDSTPVLLACLIMFIFPSSISPFLWWRRRKVAGICDDTKQSKQSCDYHCSFPTYEPLMIWRYMQEKFPWAVILLMGGGFALADGIERSGLSEWLGCALQSSLSSIAPPLVVLLFLILMTVVSEFASNSATASVFVPILLTVAQGMRINPLYFGLPAAVGSSIGFMLPVATPPNMIVFEKCKQLGILNSRQMMKAGLGLDIICILVAFFIIHTVGVVVYDLNNYPSWANGASNFSACDSNMTTFQ